MSFNNSKYYVVVKNVQTFPFNNDCITGAGATFDWLFFDNSKLIDFND